MSFLALDVEFCLCKVSLLEEESSPPTIKDEGITFFDTIEFVEGDFFFISLLLTEFVEDKGFSDLIWIVEGTKRDSAPGFVAAPNVFEAPDVKAPIPPTPKNGEVLASKNF